MRRSHFALAAIALAIGAGLAVSRLQAEPRPASSPEGVYFFRNPNGIWITTYSRGGRGRSDVHLIINGEVHEDFYEFDWSMKGREIICKRITDIPDLKIEEHNLLRSDGRIQPLRSYRAGKLLWEAPKDSAAMEFLGKEGQPKVEAP